MTKLSQTEKNEINKFLETQRPLSKEVARHFIEIGKILGITTKKLEELSFSGAIIGYMKYLEKHPKKELNIPAYLSWWMRHVIYLGIVKKTLTEAKKNPNKAEKAFMLLLEQE
ncbi:MAG TPA: hypothetical protein VG866_00515 [Candidatus Paceibacterota bacterium]|nr:hypothetical protein [Candidatus Paceibacterota bacterium]